MKDLVLAVRRILIAIGSIVMAYLAANAVVGFLLGPDVVQRPGMAVIVLVLGGLIYRDIVRRDHVEPAQSESASVPG